MGDMSKNDDLGAAVASHLERIDVKLTALLALLLDGYLRETATAKPKERTIERILVDAGLSAATVAGLLGKTKRAVYLALQREREKKPAARRGKNRETEREQEAAE